MIAPNGLNSAEYPIIWGQQRMNITDKLLKLYRVDEQLNALKSRMTSAERYFRAQSRKVKDLGGQESSLHSDILKEKATAGNFENEARTIEERMQTLRERMTTSKTNKEYTAFLTELNTIKIDKDSAESKALEYLGEVEEMESKITEIATQLTERKKVCEVARKEYEEQKAAIADRLTELEGDRATALDDIPQTAMASYNEQVHWHDGEAMSPIIEHDRRNMEYACGECNMSIPVERLSTLLGRGDLTPCPTCHRILYVGKELREAFDARLAKS